MLEGRPLRAAYLGRRGYQEALEMQHRLRREILESAAPDCLLLLEHDPVYTLGRSAKRADVVAPDRWLREHGIEIVESDRGGQVTYHGPGQLVGYPILDLKPDRRDVRRYVRNLQEVLVRLLARYGIEAAGGDSTQNIGVWSREGRKLASIGIHLKRWVTTHGFALNVSTQLDDFRGINPCGFRATTMTSVQEQTGRELALEEVAKHCADLFAEVFGYQLVGLGAEAGLGLVPAAESVGAE